MSDTPNPAPAGAEVPRAPANVSILDAMSDGDFGNTSEPAGNDDEDEAPQVTGVEIEAEPEPEGDDDAEIPMHRLRDGTQVSLGDLKKAFDEARGYRQAIPQIQQERARIEQEKQAIAAQQQQFQPVIAQVASILQQQIPPAPDPALLLSDPIEFHNQRWMHEQAVSQLRAVNAAQAEAQQRQAAEAESQRKVYLQTQQQKLVEAIPALREPEKAKAFNAEFQEIGAKVGFSAQELGQVYDHRLFLLAQYAAKGLKAEQAEAKAKATTQTKAVVAAKKVVDKPPVQAPAARQAQGVREAREAQGAMDRLKKTHSARDAEDFLARFK
jgi:hypothetical protein